MGNKPELHTAQNGVDSHMLKNPELLCTEWGNGGLAHGVRECSVMNSYERDMTIACSHYAAHFLNLDIQKN